jgi:hypothetical protein
MLQGYWHLKPTYLRKGEAKLSRPAARCCPVTGCTPVLRSDLSRAISAARPKMPLHDMLAG